jgi:hypothetical protein
VLVFHRPGLIEKGRKLVPPWLGRYVVQKKLSEISYLLTDRMGKVSRVHVNRLTRTDQDLKETQNPVEGLFPDSRRLLRNVLEYNPIKKQFKIRSAGQRGYKWIAEPAGRHCDGIQAGPQGPRTQRQKSRQKGMLDLAEVTGWTRQVRL